VLVEPLDPPDTEDPPELTDPSLVEVPDPEVVEPLHPMITLSPTRVILKRGRPRVRDLLARIMVLPESYLHTPLSQIPSRITALRFAQ
jgi:hypothetical protein